MIFFIKDNASPSSRYRIYHHFEQLHIYHGAIAQTSIFPPILQEKLLYLHRIPLTSRSLPRVVAAKLRRVPVVFDSDDLVWDEREREYNHLDAHYPPGVVRQILRGTRRMRAMMRLADALVFSTPYLAQLAAQAFRQPIYVNLNALSRKQVALSQAAWEARAKQSGAPIVIGYFSGQAKVHDEDVASIAPALSDILRRYPFVRLRVYGGLRLQGGLEQDDLAPQIERRDAVDWRELPTHIAQVDINIAPLIDNPQRRAKSAVKYLEAAAVGVPTVAARLEPYDLIHHGQTGMLAWADEEWRSCLTRLIEGRERRIAMGEAARQDVLANHTTDARSANFNRIIEEISRR